MDYQHLGVILKNARVEANLKQVDVSKKMGCTSANISSWELGKSKIDIDSLLTLCQLYHIDFVALLSELSNLNRQENRTVFSLETIEVAQAYEKADFKSKNSARYALDLPLLEPPAVEAAATIDKKQAV